MRPYVLYASRVAYLAPLVKVSKTLLLNGADNRAVCLDEQIQMTLCGFLPWQGCSALVAESRKMVPAASSEVLDEHHTRWRH